MAQELDLPFPALFALGFGDAQIIDAGVAFGIRPLGANSQFSLP